MRIIRVALACVTLSGLAACSAAPKVDFTPVTSSPLPSMQKYNAYIGKDYWVSDGPLPLCEKPVSVACGSQFLTLQSHLRVDGLVPNHYERAGTSFDAPYFYVVLDSGRSAFVDALILSLQTTTVDPVTAAAECKKKGDPKLGMNAKQVAATCWGPPNYVNAKVRATGKYEQYVYGDNKFVYLRDGIVTSVSVKGRSLEAVRSLH